MHWRRLLFILWLPLCGCITSNSSVRDITAYAITYRHLPSTAGQWSPGISHAVAALSKSPEHMRMRGILAGFPATMQRCVVIETVALNDDLDAKSPLASDATPVMVAVFETPDGIGFLTNFPRDLTSEDATDEPKTPYTGRGWRAGVLQVEKRDSGAKWPEFPNDPSKLLPGSRESAGEPMPASPADIASVARLPSALVVVTIVEQGNILTAAGIARDEDDANPAEQVSLRSRRALGKALAPVLRTIHRSSPMLPGNAQRLLQQ